MTSKIMYFNINVICYFKSSLKIIECIWNECYVISVQSVLINQHLSQIAIIIVVVSESYSNLV